MAEVKCKCPLCSSRNAERLVLSWAKGKLRTKTKSHGVGVGINNLYAMGFAFVGLFTPGAPGSLFYPLFASLLPLFYFSRSYGTSQTLLSRQAEPPYRFNALRYLGISLVSVGFVAIFNHNIIWAVEHGFLNSHTNFHVPPVETIRIYGYLGLALIIGICTAVMTAGLKYNANTWLKSEAVWQRMFMCRQCGGIYIVPEYDPAGVNQVASYKEWDKDALLPRSYTEEQKAAAEAKAG